MARCPRAGCRAASQQAERVHGPPARRWRGASTCGRACPTALKAALPRRPGHPAGQPGESAGGRGSLRGGGGCPPGPRCPPKVPIPFAGRLHRP